jgi:hypothetical protein
MMRKTQIYPGIILALVLLYSSPAFARNHESEGIGAQGMLSAGEMKTATKSGGTFTSQSNVFNGGTQVRYHSDGNAPSGPILNPRTDPRSAPITNANTINQLNTKGYSGGPGGTVILSGTGVSSTVSRAMSSPNGSMDRAVNALQSTTNAIAQHLNLPVVNQRTSAGGVNVPAVGGAFIPEDKAARMNTWAAQLGLNMADKNSHVGTTTQGAVAPVAGAADQNTVAATTGSATYTMNPLDGTDAGAILGIEPGSTRRVVVVPPVNTGTNTNSFKSDNVSPGTTGTNQSATKTTFPGLTKVDNSSGKPPIFSYTISGLSSTNAKNAYRPLNFQN